MTIRKESSQDLLVKDNFNQIKTLKQYLSDQNKILNHKVVQNSMREHNKITKLIKQARLLGLLPFTTSFD